MDWLNALAGFVVGLLVGITGVGGGSLMTPILVLLFGVAPATAVGTDLWFAAVTKLVGGCVHHSKGSVDWPVFRRLTLGSLPAAVATLAWLHFSGGGRLENGATLGALGAVLILTGLATFFKKQTHALGLRLRSTAPKQFKAAQPGLTVIAGAVLGVTVTLTSVGAGALGAVMLLYLYPFRMKPATLVGTDITHAIPLTIVAGAGHLFLGHVEFGLLGQLLLGSIPGIVAGSLLGHRAPEGVIRIAISSILVCIGLKLVAGALV